MQLNLDVLQTLLIAILLLFIGNFARYLVPALVRFNIPVPVVGGIIFAVVMTGLFLSLGIQFSFDTDLRIPLMLAFFTSIGLGADLRRLRQGGPKLALFFLAAVAFLATQNAVGIGVALLLDLHPLVGLLSGSITLSGGHGTGAAYAERFASEQNLAGVMELAMACATFGLVIGGLIGGPLAHWLITRRNLAPACVEGAAPVQQDADDTVETVSVQGILGALFAITVCLVAGAAIAELAAGAPMTLPSFVWALLVGVAIRNLAEASGRVDLPLVSIELLGSISLALFLAMSLMSLRLWELASLAGPLVLVLGAQTLTMLAFAMFITFKLMGGDYTAAVISSGHCGFGMGATPTAVANMEAVTVRFGPAPTAYIVIPLTGAFFIDLSNALVLGGFLALPLFGFPS